MGVAEAPRVPYPKAAKRFPELRQSRLASFDNCALTTRFDLEYRHGWSFDYQARGEMFHRFAGRALREMAEQGEQSIEVDVALAILHEVLRQDDIDRWCPECGTRDVRPGLSKRGMRRCGNGHSFETELVNVPMGSVRDLYWITKKWAHDNSWDTESLWSVEERLRAKVTYSNPYGGGVERVLTGQTDALFKYPEEQRVVVLDWKDMWALPAPTEVSFKGYFQQRFYGWLTMRQPEHRDVEQVTLREFYVRYSEPREATVWRSDLDDIEQEVAALAERFDRAYEEDVWPPSPGKHCSFCARPMACPILVPARGDGRIADEEHARKAAGQLVVLREAEKQLTASVQAYSTNHGPIPVRDPKGPRAMGYRRSTRVERPTKEQLERAIAEAGGTGRLDLAALYKERVATRFDLYRPDPQEEAREDAALLAALQESVAEAKARRPE